MPLDNVETRVGFENPVTGKHESLFRDADMGDTMFRVVVKSNLTMTLAVDLVRHIREVLPIMDKHGFQSVKTTKLREMVMKVMTAHNTC